MVVAEASCAYIVTHMRGSVGVRELRQNLSRHLEQVKAGKALVVTERGHEVARLIPSGASAHRYAALGQRFGATMPVGRLEDTAARLQAPDARARPTPTSPRAAANPSDR